MMNSDNRPTRHHVRWMIRRDMREVLALESMANGRDPWQEEDFLHCLRQRNCIGMVVEQGETVIGFMLYELHTKKLVLVRIAGTTEAVYASLLDRLASKLSAHRRDRITADIDERDLHHQVTLRASGYHAAWVDNNATCDDDGTWHDTFHFVWRLPVERPPIVQECVTENSGSPQ